jgi:hypothetical protein
LALVLNLDETRLAMKTFTVEVPDELAEQLRREQARLPELLALSLRQPPLSAQVYRYVLMFLAGLPTPAEIAAFGPTPEMIERHRTLVRREHAGEITPMEKAELDEYDHIEHLIVMIKTGKLRYLVSA